MALTSDENGRILRDSGLWDRKNVEMGDGPEHAQLREHAPDHAEGDEDEDEEDDVAPAAPVVAQGARPAKAPSYKYTPPQLVRVNNWFRGNLFVEAHAAHMMGSSWVAKGIRRRGSSIVG
ncbi:hypothetical protein FKW77_000736 [Venturia effusa]|uniref:Uncharacterized protein n=1 Tax=Venturia effusa TaxID=50376 RepID=A0A517LGE9_9PEZI|nr:hypothetical protein FKW77_000736 [Venturia effusa]